MAPEGNSESPLPHYNPLLSCPAMPHSSLDYTLTRKDTSFWLGFLRSFISTSWSLSEMIMIPMVIFLLGRGARAESLIYIATIFALILAGPVGISSYLVNALYLRYHMPRRVQLDMHSHCISISGPNSTELVDLDESAWAFGSTLHDTVGELLPIRRAILIRLPREGGRLPSVIISVPDTCELDQWEQVLRSAKASHFVPPPTTRYFRKPPVIVSVFSRGASIGLLIANCIILILRNIFERECWTLGTYLGSVIAGIWASSYVLDTPEDKQSESHPKLRFYVSCVTLLVMVGILGVQQEELKPLPALLAITIHVAVGMILTRLLILAFNVVRLA